MKFLIADDHAGVRKNVREILKEEYQTAMFYEASNGAEVLEKIAEELLDLIILDITMPEQNGLEILKQIRAQFINIPILMLSMHPENQYASRAIKAGASGYLNKNNVSDNLIVAIKHILKGCTYPATT